MKTRLPLTRPPADARCLDSAKSSGARHCHFRSDVNVARSVSDRNAVKRKGDSVDVNLTETDFGVE